MPFGEGTLSIINEVEVVSEDRLGDDILEDVDVIYLLRAKAISVDRAVRKAKTWTMINHPFKNMEMVQVLDPETGKMLKAGTVSSEVVDYEFDPEDDLPDIKGVYIRDYYDVNIVVGDDPGKARRDSPF